MTAASSEVDSKAGGVGNLLPRPEPGCAGELAWRLDLAPGSDLTRAAERLAACGYRIRCMAETLQVLRHPGGHELVLVPRTGRVQLRVYFLTPHEERPTVVRRLADDLASSLGG